MMTDITDKNKSRGFDRVSDLAALLKENDLGELTIRDGDFSITLKAKVQPIYQVASQNREAIAAKKADTSTNAIQQSETDKSVVKSPIVGTFYSSSAPDKPPFVTVGQSVKKGDTLFIIESMKLMNEIQSEFDGVVKEFLVSDGQAVEFHQPIMIIIVN